MKFSFLRCIGAGFGKKNIKIEKGGRIVDQRVTTHISNPSPYSYSLPHNTPKHYLSLSLPKSKTNTVVQMDSRGERGRGTEIYFKTLLPIARTRSAIAGHRSPSRRPVLVLDHQTLRPGYEDAAQSSQTYIDVS